VISINRFENLEFTSNTYLIKHKFYNNDVFLIDIGNPKKVLDFLLPNQKVKAIFLTHAHYDHIYGINKIIDQFPKCIVHCSEYAYKALLSEKLNLSFYRLEPIVFKGGNINLLYEDLSIKLFANYFLKVLRTEGHTKGSLSFVVNEGVFTGDALIPGVPVVTKLKSGNKNEAKKSIKKIHKQLELEPEKNIYPGHGPIFKKSEVNWSLYN